MTNWPDEFPDPEEIKRLKREQQAQPAPGDVPKEKILPTWGIPASTGKDEPGGGWRGKKTVAPVDKAALKRAAEDAKWAAQQQKEIARAGKQQAKAARDAARDARAAREWREAADREIAAANRGGGEWRGGAAYYDETTVEGRSGCGCGPRGGCILALLPTWLVVLILILLLAGMWASSG